MNTKLTEKNTSKKKLATPLRITVCGLGFVGSTIAAVWLRRGATVMGLDKDPSVVSLANKGKTHTGEPRVAEAYLEGIKSGRFHATTNPEEAYRRSNIKIFTVPVGLRNSKADLSTLLSAIDNTSRNLKKGDTVIVKPTIPIGTSRRLLIPRLEKKSGLKTEKDFLYIYSPERTSSGQAVADIEEHYPAIVSGAGPKSLEAGAKLYSMIASKGVLKLTTMEAAEAEKIFEGIYRDVNIALANEFAKISMATGVDFWEARQAANSQPYSHIHQPGIGVGGACIPIYPHFLISVAEEVGEKVAMTRLAREINDAMPSYWLRIAIGESKDKGTDLVGKKAAVLGLAFRANIPDKRLSPTYDIVRELQRINMKIWVHDPLIKQDRDLPSNVILTDDIAKTIRDASLIVVATNHEAYKQITGKLVSRLTSSNLVILDGRRILNPADFENLRLITIGTGNKNSRKEAPQPTLRRQSQ
ncbi:MAG: nucleotide sugar dehydrogenase [Thaumarchaeota archaeon]|nr:nucleotide sugar dehydrogenase [Nitrososphaerota archaeon]